MADFARGDDDKGKRKKPSVNLVLGKSRPPKAVYKDNRCRVCQSPHREQIEIVLMTGMSAKKVAEFFERFTPAGETPISRESIGNHLRKHTDLTSASIRYALEQQSKASKAHIEEMEGTILTAGGILNGLLIKGWESVLHDEVEFKPKDVMDILDRIERLEAIKDQSDYEQLKVESVAFGNAVKQIVPREQWQSIVELWEQILEQREMTLENHMAIESTATEVKEEEDTDA